MRFGAPGTSSLYSAGVAWAAPRKLAQLAGYRWAGGPTIKRWICVSEAGFKAATPETAKRGRKLRLDDACLQLYPQHTRKEVQSWIMQGKVAVDGNVVSKAGSTVHNTARITISARAARYVCRGGEKLEAALAKFSVPVAGKTALDCGISTGGFTDCLLQHGARHVVGVDVGYGQVAERVRTDPRVTVLERTNLRYLDLARLPGQARVDLVTLDLSFISILRVVPAVTALLAADGGLVALIKPQFEARKDQVEAGGVIKNPEVHREVMQLVVTGIAAAGYMLQGTMESPLRGSASGNTEFLAYFLRRPD